MTLSWSSKRHASIGHSRRFRIQPFLQFEVEVQISKNSPVHGGQHLYLLDGVKTKTPGNLFCIESNHPFQDLLGVLLFNKIEIRALLCDPIPGEWEIPLDGFDGHSHDHALLGLTENLRQSHDGKKTRIDHILQHISRADGGQLVNITHQDQVG